MPPDAKEDLLRDILGFRRIAKHPARKPDHARQVPAHELSCCALVARTDTEDQFLVRIPHGWATNSETSTCAPLGVISKAEPCFTLCILRLGLPRAIGAGPGSN